jgi:hypothetical protein
MKIFAFGHRRKVGKDTAARFLVNHIRLEHGGLQVQRVSFATKLKQMCFELYGRYGLQSIDYYEEHPDEKETFIPGINSSPRELWIRFGNFVRDFNPHAWIDFAVDTAKSPVVLIPDLRYLDEVERLREYDATLIKIERDSAPKFDDVADTKLASFTGWDYVVHNNGTLAEFHECITKIVDKELK